MCDYRHRFVVTCPHTNDTVGNVSAVCGLSQQDPPASCFYLSTLPLAASLVPQRVVGNESQASGEVGSSEVGLYCWI